MSPQPRDRNVADPFFEVRLTLTREGDLYRAELTIRSKRITETKTFLTDSAAQATKAAMAAYDRVVRVCELQLREV